MRTWPAHRAAFSCHGCSRPTCPNEEDIILAVSSCHTVHRYVGEAVAHVGLHEDGSLAVGQDGVVHQWVVAGKLDHVIWEVLGGTESAKGFAGTL